MNTKFKLVLSVVMTFGLVQSAGAEFYVNAATKVKYNSEHTALIETDNVSWSPPDRGEIVHKTAPELVVTAEINANAAVTMKSMRALPVTPIRPTNEYDDWYPKREGVEHGVANQITHLPVVVASVSQMTSVDYGQWYPQKRRPISLALSDERKAANTKLINEKEASSK